MLNQEKSFQVRVRFAPSPTGPLHIGGARTALYSYLFSKSKKGIFVLRVEDTDLDRSSEENLRHQLLSLKWLGLDWDEGPVLDSEVSLNETFETKKTQDLPIQGIKKKQEIKEKGSFGPYFQSQRLALYEKEAKKLLKKGQAFYCFLTDEEWDQEREKAKKKGLFFEAKSPYRNSNLKDALKKIEKGEKASLRFKNDLKKEFTLKDEIRGLIKLPSKMVGDFVLIRSNGIPVYNFCCVIDDVFMKISHVFRAEEHLSNSLRQLMIYEALNYPLPKFGHFSLVLGTDRKKLSKRHGACSLEEYKKRGYLPEALINFISLLGWSSPEAKEIFNLKDLIHQFSLDRLNPASAVFDEKRLNWINATHLRSLDFEELWEKLEVFLKKENLKTSKDKAWKKKALNILKSSMVTLQDGVQLLRPFLETENQNPPLTEESLTEESKNRLKQKETDLVLKAWLNFLLQSNEEYISKENFKKFIKTTQNQFSIKGKALFMPLRFSMIRKLEGSELKELISLISRKELIEKTKNLLDWIKKNSKVSP